MTRDVSILPPAVEVDWFGEWAAITNLIVGFSVQHGTAKHGNPDRPTVASAVGYVTLAAAPTDEQVSGRRPCRIREGPLVVWQGWISAPTSSPGPQTYTRWLLHGRLAEHLEEVGTLNQGARTVADTLGDAALWQRLIGGTATGSALAERTMMPIVESDRTGAIVSRLSAVATAAPCETSTGQLAVASLLSADDPVSIATPDMLIISVESEDRSDRIRNQAVIGRSAVSGEVTQRIQRAVLEITAPAGAPDDDGRYTATVQLPPGVASELTAVAATDAQGLVIGRTWRGVPPGGVTLPPGSAIWQSSGSEPAVTSTLSAAGDTVEVTVTVPPYGWRVTAGDSQVTTGYSPTAFPTEAAYTSLDAYFAVFSLVFGWRCEVALAYTHTAPDDPRPPLVVRDERSIALWGLRPTDVDPWLADDADYQRTIDVLGGLRREHSFTVPMRQPTAAARALVQSLSPGDYAALDILDAARGVSVDAVCLVAERYTWYSPREGWLARFRCVEIPGAVAPADRGNPVSLGSLTDPVYLGDTSQPVYLGRGSPMLEGNPVALGVATRPVFLGDDRQPVHLGDANG